jgi:drug/metabolite transporter (DMT)-like permease
VAILLAVIASFMVGGADFLGGVTARRAPAVTVVATSHLAGLVVALVAAFAAGTSGPVGADPLWGAGAGAAGAIGLVLLYHALATTRFAVAAPAAALSGAVVPVVFGVIIGERPEALAWAGIIIALPALLLLPSGHGDDPHVRSTGMRAILLGTAAGLMFALFGILLSRAGDTSGWWPLVGARAASIPTIAVLALGVRRPVFAKPPTLWWALVVGALDMAANIVFLAALRRGLLSLVILITSLYPAVTVALARVVLREQMTRRQVGGMALAAVGVAMISVA